MKGIEISVTSWVQVEMRGLDHDGGPTTAHPRLHEGDQPWGAVCVGAYNPCPVDNEVSESSMTAKLIIIDVGSSEITSGAQYNCANS